MKALVIYDSVFGNTEKIALIIGETLEAETVKVSNVSQDQLRDIECLVVGSPTRAFKPTKDITNFLKRIPLVSLDGVKVASFDTRMDIETVNNTILTMMVRFFGYADKPIADRLKKKGGILAVPSEGFIVEDSEGPLSEGELERSAAWAIAIKNGI